jgi:hypothetical protein
MSADFIFMIAWATYNAVGLVNWLGHKKLWVNLIMMCSIPPIVFIWWDYYRVFGPTAPIYINAGIVWVEKLCYFLLLKRHTTYAHITAFVCSIALVVNAIVVICLYTSSWLLVLLLLVEAVWYFILGSGLADNEKDCCKQRG